MTRLRIDGLYAWVATEPDGGEGICGMVLDGRNTPLIGADMARIESHRPHAEQVARLTGFPVQLVRFHAREVLEHLTPGGRP